MCADYKHLLVSIVNQQISTMNLAFSPCTVTLKDQKLCITQMATCLVLFRDVQAKCIRSTVIVCAKSS